MLRSTTDRPYSRSSCCWNCKSPGHIAAECNRERQLFCSYCLKDGTTTRNCGCHSSALPVYTLRFPPLAENDPRKYPECFRADRAHDQPIYIGVGDERFRTYINTSQAQTSVGWLVCTKASLCHGTRREFKRTEEGLISEAAIPLRLEEMIRTIRCRVTESEPDVIVLGGDALQCFGYKIFLANTLCLDHPGCSPISHQSVYDMPIYECREKSKPPKRIPMRIKNPIDLSLDTSTARHLNYSLMTSLKSPKLRYTLQNGILVHQAGKI